MIFKENVISLFLLLGFIILLYNLYKIYNHPIIISIDGNIGSGKSTFMRLLKNKFGDKYSFTKEPVDIWMSLKDKDDGNILEKFYKNKNRWSYTFQNLAFITRILEMNKSLKLNSKIIFTERSIHTDYNIFAKALFKDGHISEIEMKIYSFWFNHFKYNITHQIYIKTNVDNCMKRISMRNRQGENNISKDYISMLDNLHNNWLLNEPNVLVLNGNYNFKDNEILSNDMINKIKEKGFLNRYNIFNNIFK